MKTIAIRIVALLALLVPALLAPASAQAHPHPYCGITWGSLDKSSMAASNPAAGPGDLVDIRTGRHACYDRLVVDVDGSAYGYWVSYVPEVRSGGSGFVVPTSGGAKLQISVIAPAHDDAGRPTFSPADPLQVKDVTGYRTFRDVTWAGTFEAQSEVGLGVRARLPFRVFTLTGPGDGSRLVVDVAHRW